MKSALLFIIGALFAYFVISIFHYHPHFAGPMPCDSERPTKNPYAFAARDPGQVIGVFPHRPRSIAGFSVNEGKIRPGTRISRSGASAATLNRL